MKVLTITKDLDYTDSREQLLALVLAEKIAELGNTYIYRYHVFQDAFNWTHEPCRLELKAIARILFDRLHLVVPLLQIEAQEMHDILEGKVIPAKFVGDCQITSPSLEDFAMTRKENLVAKEVEESPAVLQYIEEHNLHAFSFDRTEVSQPIDEQTQPKGQPQRPAEIDKKLCQAKALDLWQTLNLNITAMSKDPEILKAGGKNYKIKTVQIWLREVAPAHIKGKRGRPKKPNP